MHAQIAHRERTENQGEMMWKSKKRCSILLQKTCIKYNKIESGVNSYLSRSQLLPSSSKLRVWYLSRAAQSWSSLKPLRSMILGLSSRLSSGSGNATGGGSHVGSLVIVPGAERGPNRRGCPNDSGDRGGKEGLLPALPCALPANTL